MVDVEEALPLGVDTDMFVVVGVVPVDVDAVVVVVLIDVIVVDKAIVLVSANKDLLIVEEVVLYMWRLLTELCFVCTIHVLLVRVVLLM